MYCMTETSACVCTACVLFMDLTAPWFGMQMCEHCWNHRQLLAVRHRLRHRWFRCQVRKIHKPPLAACCVTFFFTMTLICMRLESQVGIPRTNSDSFFQGQWIRRCGDKWRCCYYAFKSSSFAMALSCVLLHTCIDAWLASDGHRITAVVWHCTICHVWHVLDACLQHTMLLGNLYICLKRTHDVYPAWCRHTGTAERRARNILSGNVGPDHRVMPAWACKNTISMFNMHTTQLRKGAQFI